VFDGKNGPYAETDTPCPIGYYGRTKLAGENTLRISGTLHTIIRTNVLYGIIPNGRPDFVRWVVEELKQKRHIRIVTDQINNPTFIDDLVTAVATVERYKKYGLFNIGGMEMLSRFDFTMRIIDAFDLDRRYVEAISTEQLQQAARRPLKSGLIILKAQTELDYKPSPLDESLLRMKQELAL
jgi:dTDP-4-dehydrorhamnose reductase